MLRSVDQGLEVGSLQREVIQKAGIALSIAFMRNLRSEIERLYEHLDKPLTDSQRAHLRGMGIVPDE